MTGEPITRPLDPLAATLQAAASHFDRWPVRAAITEVAFLAARERDARRRVLERMASPIWAVRALRTPRGAEVMRGRFLFIAQHVGAGWATLEPVIRDLVARGEAVTVAATAPVLAQRAEAIAATGASFVSLDRLALRVALRPAAFARREIDEAWAAVAPALDAAGVAAAPLAPYFRALAARAFGYRVAVRRLLSGVAGAVIVNHADFTTAAVGAIEAARDLGVREVTLQHGLTSAEYFPTRTGAYLLWGEEFRGLFEERGTDPAALTVTGAPRLDALALLDDAAQAKARARGRAAWSVAERPAVLFLSHRHSPAPAGLHEAVDALLVEAAALAPEIDWLVRLHPQEAPGSWDARIAGTRLRLAPPSALNDALLAADVVASPFSSTLLEAMLLGRPALQLLPVAADQVPCYAGAKAVVSTAQGLVQQARAARNGEATWIAAQQLACRQWVARPGSATAAVTSYLLDPAAPIGDR
jgi:hypothetical protein